MTGISDFMPCAYAVYMKRELMTRIRKYGVHVHSNYCKQ